MPPPRKKRPPAGQSVPDAGTISAHRDAPRRAGGTAGQKPPERGLKNSPRRSRRLCADCAHVGMAGMEVLVPGRRRTGHPPGQRARPGAKTAPAGPETVCRLRPWEKGGNGRCLVPGSITLGARRGRGHARAQKQPPAEAGGCLDAGYGCYLPRAIRVIWMHRVGSTARPRIMPS